VKDQAEQHSVACSCVERHRRGSRKANVAIGRSILVIVWHLLSDPYARYADLGPDFYAGRIDPDRRRREHVRQLEALGYTVILERAA
jgi:transposase